MREILIVKGIMNSFSFNSLKRVQISETAAAASWDVKGEVIASGKSVSRVGLIGMDSRFQVAVKVIEGLSLISRLLLSLVGRRFYVETKIDGKRVLVNINSVAKRLHIQPEEVKTAAKEGTLERLIAQRTEEMTTILNQYERIFNRYGSSQEKLQEQTGLTPETLMEALKLGRQQLKVKERNSLIPIKVKSHSLLVNLTENKEEEPRLFLMIRQTDGLFVARDLFTGKEIKSQAKAIHEAVDECGKEYWIEMHYQTFLKEFNKGDGESIRKKDQLRLGLTQEVLKRVVRQAVTPDSPQIIIEDKVKRHKFKVQYDVAKQKLNIVDLTKKEKKILYRKFANHFQEIEPGWVEKKEGSLKPILRVEDLRKIFKKGRANPSQPVVVFDTDKRILNAWYDPNASTIKFKDVTEEKIAVYYKKALENFTKKGQQLIHKQNPAISLTPEHLEALVKNALSVDAASAIVIQNSKGVWNTWYNAETREIEMGQVGNFIDQGSAGKVRHYTNLSSSAAPPEVVKHVRQQFTQIAIDDLNNEGEKLQRIHKKGKVYGIQDQPRRLGYLAMKGLKHPDKIKIKLAYITRRYTKSYSKDIIQTATRMRSMVPAFLKDIHQLMAGFAFLAENHYLCGDIKPDNNLVNQNPLTREREVVMSDLGSVRHVSDVKSSAELSGDRRLHTPFYSSREEVEAAERVAVDIEKLERELETTGNKKLENKIEELSQKLIAMEKKRDVFSMGCTLYEALTTKSPYLEHAVLKDRIDLTSYQGLPPKNADPSIQHFIEHDIPKEVKDVITKMVDRSPERRPTALEAFKTIDQCLKRTQPKLHASILANIQKNYPGSLSLFAT